MTRYYIRMIHSSLLMRVGASGPHWTNDLKTATGFLSYGDAHCEAMRLKRMGYVVAAIDQAEAVQALQRLQEEGSPCQMTA